MFKDLSPQEAFNIIEENENNSNFIIIDVRTYDEFKEEHINGAVQLDYYSVTFKEELDQLNKNNIYLIYCRTGVRSRNTLDLMNSLGFNNCFNLLGGITRWKEMGMPTVSP
ncbi:MAG: rhodanese-like domain-containing protein [Methanobacteriaceae archaeon]|nr:rhodanese-like domain-containing protein [Methanobacteriaceae archaeon]